MAKDNLPATIIRPTHIYGPRDKNTVKVFKTIKQLGVFPLIGGGTALFQPLYIDDLVRGLIMCMEKKNVSVGNTYLAAGKEYLTYRDFALLSARLMDVPLRTFVISERLSKPLADVSEKLFTSLNKEPPLTRSRVEFFSRNQAYKIGKIYRDIGFFPEIDLETGLSKTIDWFKTEALL
jgi:nucleoside-diphosphate-sugar epimerase